MNFRLEHLPMPLMIVPPKPLDDEALMAFCVANDLYRIERTNQGELRVMSPTGSGTGSRNAEITRQLGNWTREDGRGVAFDSNTGFTLPDGSMLSPDASWMNRGRWKALSDRDRARFSPACPEFVIELRSESDGIKALEAKMELWLENGAELGWLIDPADRSVTIYRPRDEVERMVDLRTVQGTGPVAGFELVMGWIWEC